MTFKLHTLLLAAALTLSNARLSVDPVYNAETHRGLEEERDEAIAKIELAKDVTIKYFDIGDGVLIVGTSGPAGVEEAQRAADETKDLSPMESFELLSGKDAPDALVNLQARLDAERADNEEEDIIPRVKLGEDLVDEKAEKEDPGGRRLATMCRRYARRTGDWTGEITNAAEITAHLLPYRGCAKLTMDFYSGGTWLNFANHHYRACAGGWAWVRHESGHRRKRIRIYEAYGDGYDLILCYE